MSDNSSASEKGASEVEDADLKMLHARRMVELRKRMSQSIAKKAQEERTAKQPKKLTDRELLLRSLIERGDEVLASAEVSYPSQTAILIPELANLIREGKITTITGGELLQFFRSIGMRVSVSTSISVQEHGKFVSLAEKLKKEED